MPAALTSSASPCGIRMDQLLPVNQIRWPAGRAGGAWSWARRKPAAATQPATQTSIHIPNDRRRVNVSMKTSLVSLPGRAAAASRRRCAAAA